MQRPTPVRALGFLGLLGVLLLPGIGWAGDALEHARPVAVNERVRFHLTTPDAREYFTFHISRLGTLQLQWGGLPGKDVPEWSVLDKSGERLMRWSGQPLRLVPGTYVLMLRGSEALASPSARLFRLLFVSDRDPHEPNDTLGHATAVRLQEAVPVALEPSGDVDWFKVMIPEKGYLTELVYNVSFFGKPQDWAEHQPTGIRLDAYSEKGESLGSFEDDWYSFREMRRELLITTPGPVYVKVHQEPSPAQPLSLRIQFNFLKESDVKHFSGRRGRSEVIFLDLSEPNSSDRIQAILLAKRRDYTHIPVDRVETQLHGAFEQALRETTLPAPRSSLPFVLLLLVLAVALGLFLTSRRRK